MAATAAAAALLWLPTPGALRAPEATATVAAEAKPPLKRVEEAVVVPPVVAQGTPPEAATNTTAQAATAPAEGEAAPLVQSSLDDELRAGREALAAAQPAQARAAFQRALALQPDQAEAKVGMVEAASLEGLLAALAQGTRAEAAGDFDAARERYQAALAQRASFQPARTALARVEQQQREVEFDHLLAAGREALRLGRIETAQAAYLRASAIHPDDARVQDGGQRLAEVLRSRQNGADLAAGAALEREERWDDALAHYKQVLARDSKLRFAQEGFTRSEGRAALERELQDYLARPERLTAPAVGQAAQRALARGEAQGTGAPRLQQQLAQLRKLLGSTAVPVRVALTSDNNTLVTVMELGELGSFVVRELTLPPGDYTIVGRRTGFRDVRYELRIAPGQPIAALTVQCTEPII
jgi:tetratricopeptide (TPR) repeat protein